MQVTKNITLDLLETGSPVIIKAKQNDRNTRYIAAHLYVDGLAYPVPSGTEIAFRYKKPDGTAGFYDALPDNSPAITVSGNTVTVELVEQVLTAAGCVHCEINMYNAASEKLTTFTFEIAVEESVLNDAEIISSDYYNVLTAEIAKALQAVTDATEQAENAAQSAQDAADSAAMSKDWAAGQPVTYSGAPVSIAYAGTNRIASITAYGENAQGGTTEAPVALTGVDSVHVCGRNLLPLPYSQVSETKNGLNIAVNADGTITVSGTATAETYLNLKPIPASLYRLMGVTGIVPAYDYPVTKNGFTFFDLTIQPHVEFALVYIVITKGSVVNRTYRPYIIKSAEPLPYETYQGSVTPLPIPRPLHKVGDVRDVCRTRVKSVYDKRIVLDGTENWNISSSKPNSFLTPVSERIVNGLSDSYPTLKSPEIGTKNGIYLNYTADIIVTDLACSTVEEFKAHLSAHPITVYYRSTAYDGTNGLDVCLTEYQTGYIESYADESITTAWISSTGALSTGAEVAYVLSSPETYATDPLDIDNAAGPLTVMTGGEVGVRMTELIGSRSPELTAKMDRGIYFQVGNLNLGDNTNFLNPVNQQGQASYSAKNGSTLCIDRWILGSGGAYDVAARTLSAASYANRACGLWQANHLGEHWLEIGSTITFSAYINGKYHSGTMAVLNRDSYSSFSAVPAGYTCDDFEVVCCTYAGNPLLYNLGIYAKKQLVINWVKWERGSAATPYALKPFPDELAICQRYFNAIAIEVAPAYFLNGSIHYFPASLFPARMRVVPTIEIISAGVGNVGTVAASAVTVAMDVNGIREIIVNAGTSAYDIYNKLTLDMRISANY